MKKRVGSGVISPYIIFVVAILALIVFFFVEGVVQIWLVVAVMFSTFVFSAYLVKHPERLDVGRSGKRTSKKSIRAWRNFYFAMAVITGILTVLGILIAVIESLL